MIPGTSVCSLPEPSSAETPNCICGNRSCIELSTQPNQQTLNFRNLHYVIIPHHLLKLKKKCNSLLIYFNKYIVSDFEYSKANDMPKGVIQRMTHNSFQGDYPVCTHISHHKFFCTFVYCFFQYYVCVHTRVCLCTRVCVHIWMRWCQ